MAYFTSRWWHGHCKGVFLVMNDTATARPEVKEKSCTTDPAHWLDLYGDFLFNFAVGQLRDASEAEDLVQDTFLAAFKSRDRFAGQCSERTWLVSILRHKICDRLRAKCRHPRLADLKRDADSNVNDMDESLIWLHESAAQCLTPDRRMDLQEFRAALELALGNLPPRIAQAFQLYEIEECSGSEICATLNISESNLWVMLHRARTQLRKALAPTWGKNHDKRSSRG
jgi:RNA polymerase sigma-70 factor (TIGR02943 family)